MEELVIKTKVLKTMPLYKNSFKVNGLECLQLEGIEYDVIVTKDLYKDGDILYYVRPLVETTCELLISKYQHIHKSASDKVKEIQILPKKYNLHKGNINLVYSCGLVVSPLEIKKYVKELKNSSKYSKLLDYYDLPYNMLANEILELKNSERVIPQQPVAKDSTHEKLEKPEYVDLLLNKEDFNRIPVDDRVFTLSKEVEGAPITLKLDNESKFIFDKYNQLQTIVETVLGKRKKKWWEWLMFWKKYDLTIKKSMLSDSKYVQLGYPILQKIEEAGYKNITLHGTITGTDILSPNKFKFSKTPVSNLIYFHGAEDENGNMYNENEFQKMIKSLNLLQCPLICTKEFTRYDDLVNYCNFYFLKNIVKGIMIRNNSISYFAKAISNTY